MSMLNLLPPDLKLHYRFARRNTSLVGVLSQFGVGLIVMVLIAVAGTIYLSQTAGVAKERVTSAQKRLDQENYSAVESQVTEMSNNLKLAVTVLSKEVLFSKLLKQLAVIVPSNVSLSGIKISQLEGAVDITALTKDYQSATQLQVNLADPDNQIFSKADVISITCTAGNSTANANYPCTVIIRALFAKNNSFYLINNSKKGS